MNRFSCSRATVAAVIVSFLISPVVFASSATLQNAGFDTYIAASDSFAFWKADRDATGGTKFKISQETAAPASGTGALKMELMAGVDTATECRITGEVKNLPPNSAFTVTAKVKYADMPTYWNAMIHLQQATLTPGTWVWTDRKWLSMWGNDPGAVNEWTQVSMSDVSADSANVFNLIISLKNAGTLWVDDIAITYTDAPVTYSARKTMLHGSGINNNRIVFGAAMPYALEAFGVNGKQVFKASGKAGIVDLNTLGLQRGAYVVKVRTAQKSWSGRVMIGK